jgi:DNA-binding IclR family transcriptional regulator
MPDVNAIEAKGQGPSQHFRVPAVDRAMNLFELLANSGSGLTLSELSRKLNMPKSATHYLIYTLATRGYLLRASDGRLSLGLHLADVASAVKPEQNLRSIQSHLYPNRAARRGGAHHRQSDFRSRSSRGSLGGSSP